MSLLTRHSSSSLLDSLGQWSEERPEAPAYRFLLDGEVVAETTTWRELEAAARRVARALETVTEPGDRVLLLYPSGLELVRAFLGCLLAGRVAVPAYPPRPRRPPLGLAAIASNAEPAAVLTISSQLARLEAAAVPGLEAVRWLATDELPAGAEAGWTPPRVSAQTLALLQYTSGSTATPKGVCIRHDHLLANQEMIRLAFGTDASSVIAGWLPLYHDMGLIGNILHCVYVGATCLLMSPQAFLTQPLRWLRAISDHRVTVSGGPSFAYELCADRARPEGLAGLDLSSWRVAFCGAEPVRAGVLERFARTFAAAGFRSDSFYPCYGLAEATLFVTGGDAGKGYPELGVDGAALDRFAVVAGGPRRLVGCGRPRGEASLRIVDPERRTPCAADRVGEVWVKGPSVAGGYWKSAAASTATFGAELATEGGETWLRTGDLGFVHGGHLFLTGRLKDLIILRGRNVYPEDVEALASAGHAAVATARGAAFAVEVDAEERLVLVQELRRGAEGEPQEIARCLRQAVAEGLEVNVHEVVLIKAGTLPRTTSGKVRRQATRGLYLAGELAVIAQAKGPEAPLAAAEVAVNRAALLALPPASRRGILERYVAAQVAAAARLPPSELGGTDNLSAFGVDSLVAVEIHDRLAEGLGVKVSLRLLLGGGTLGEVVAAVETALSSADASSEVAFAWPRPSGRFPLSFGQRALWFSDQLGALSGAYSIVSALWLPPELDLSALRRACQRAVDHQPSLRTIFGDDSGEPYQEVQESLELDFREFDARGLDGAAFERLLCERAYAPFDLSRGPLFRVEVFHLEGGRRAVLPILHHIIADFASLAVLTEEISEELRYGGGARADPLPASFADFVAIQEEAVASGRYEAAGRYWVEELGSDPPYLDLPTDRPRPPLQTYRGAGRRRLLGHALAAGIDRLGREHGATLFMTLLAAFQTLLFRLSGQRRLLVGAPLSSRPHRDFAALVGYFINPAVIAADVDPELPFAALLAATRGRTLNALDHQDFPYPLLVERLRPSRDPSRPPIFQAMCVVYQDRRAAADGMAAFGLGDPAARLRLGEHEVVPLDLAERRVQFELSLTAARAASGLALGLSYNADLFDATTAERWLSALGSLLAAVATDAARRLADLPLLSPAESHQLQREWSHAPAAATSESTLDDLFTQQAAATPEAVALVAGEERISYAGLARSSLALAASLRTQGVGPEVRVGVCLPRTAPLVEALLAVLAAGGAYVPLDPAYPAERLAYMLEDSRAALLVTDAASRPQRAGDGPPVLDLDLPRAPAVLPPPAAPSADQLAYVIYTSGSTGRPKGVAITARSAVAMVRWAQGVFSPVELGGVLAATSICFDLSVFELFVPLSSGGKVLLVPNALHLPSLAAAHEVTLINTVPSAIAELARLEGIPSSVATVNLAGEPLPRRVVDAVFAASRVAAVLNLYGPSEDTTYSTAARVERRGGAPTIGRPVTGGQLYLADRHRRLAPVGVPGELLLAGAGLARGYLGRPALTAERFLPNPFAGAVGDRLYATGDLARYRADGEVEFLGRFDHQVKVRGFRVELGEIEAVLTRHPAVEDAVVIAHRQGESGAVLVAYWVARSAARPELVALRSHLARSLPEVMVPGIFVELPALPLTTSGKVDRKALPRPDLAAEATADGAPPRSPTEEILCGFFSELLGRPRVGIHDGFFELGGHSLLAMRLLARIWEVCGVRLPLATAFQEPTVEALARQIVALRSAGAAPPAPITPAADRRAPAELSFAQQRLWFLDRLEPGRSSYNTPWAFRLSGRLEVATLRRTLAEIVRRHEVLRTTFPEVEGRPRALVGPPVPPATPLLDLCGHPNPPALAHALATREAWRPFDLGRGPLLRCVLLRLADADHAVVLTLHHAVSDAWSIGVLAREAAALYSGFARGEASPLPELPVQYSDFARWQREHLTGDRLSRQLDFWRRQLGGELPALSFPGERILAARPSDAGGRVPLIVTPSLSTRLLRLARALGATPFMLLEAALAALLYRVTGQADVILGADLAGRDRPETEPLIGFFIKLLALRIPLAGNPTFSELVVRVRGLTLAAFDHQDVPFERVVEEVQPERNAGHSPLFRLVLVLDNTPAVSELVPGLELAPLNLLEARAPFDMSVWLRQAEGGFSGFWGFRRELFDDELVRGLAARLLALLEAACAAPETRLDALPLLGEAERAEERRAAAQREEQNRGRLAARRRRGGEAR